MHLKKLWWRFAVEKARLVKMYVFNIDFKWKFLFLNELILAERYMARVGILPLFNFIATAIVWNRFRL